MRWSDGKLCDGVQFRGIKASKIITEKYLNLISFHEKASTPRKLQSSEVKRNVNHTSKNESADVPTSNRFQPLGNLC